MRVLMIPSGIGLSHLTRLMLIADELRQRGAKVGFAYQEENRLLKQFGVPVFTASDVSVTDFASNVFAGYAPAFVDRCVAEELQAIDTFRPEAIVGDLRMTAAISSRVAGLPYVSVVNGYTTDYFDPVDVLLPKDARPSKRRLASVVGRAVQARQKRRLAAPFRAVARRHGIRDLVSLYDFLTGNLTLIADLPEFCPLKGLPKTFRYVGPLVWEGSDDGVPEFLKHPNDSRQLVYATTGNTGKEKLIELVVDAFRNNSSYRVVLTTGAYISPDKVPKASNIHAARFIPGSKAMRHAQAVIHCGGNGTTYQAMAQGVPALVIPFNNDQRINAWLVMRHKTGIPLSPAGLTGDQVEGAVKTLVENASIQNSLQRFKELLTRANGPRSAVDEITAFMTARKPSSPEYS